MATTGEKSEERYAYLRLEYGNLFKNGELVLPEQLDYKKLEDDKFFNDVYQPAFLFSNTHVKEILELLSYVRPKEAELVTYLTNINYRILPKACKFSNNIVLGKNKTQMSFHGPQPKKSHFLVCALVVGSHKFFSYFSLPGFDYDFYDSYLRKNYYLDNKVPRCYKNADPDRTKSDCLSDNPLYYHQPDYYCKPMHLWAYFKIAMTTKADPFLTHCTKIVQDIETGIPHCLTFGQFATLFSLFRNMKFACKEDEFKLVNNQKLYDYIYTGKLTCCFNCNYVFQITLDLKHQVVFILGKGKHLKGCREFQKRKGYLFMKDVLVLDNNIEQCKSIVRMLYSPQNLNYYGLDEIDLSSRYNKTNIEFKYEATAKEGMNQLVHLLETDVRYYSLGKSPVRLQVKPEIITKSYKFNSSKGFLMGTERGLTKLSNHSYFHVNYQKTKIKDTTLLHVTFMDEVTNIFTIGCVSLLYGPLNIDSLTQFAITLKDVLNKVNPSAFYKLKTITTKESSILSKTFKKQFPYATVVENIVPNAKKIFNNLNKVSQDMMTKAMLNNNPVLGRSQVHAALLFNKIWYADLMNSYRQNLIGILINSSLTAKQREDRLKINDSRLDKAEKVKKDIDYLERAESKIGLWSSFFINILLSKNFKGDVDELEQQMCDKIDEVVQSKYQQLYLPIIQQLNIGNHYANMVTQAMRRHADPNSIDDDIKDLIEKCHKFYEPYKDLKLVKEHGFISLTDEPGKIFERTYNSKYGEYGNDRAQYFLVNFYDLQSFLIFQEFTDVSNKNIYLYDYLFAKKMNIPQKYAFQNVMNLYKWEGTRLSCETMFHRNNPLSEKACCCAYCSDLCIPCEHMLYLVYQRCIGSVIKSKKFNIGSKQFNEAVDQMFDEELRKNEHYMKIVTRDPSIVYEQLKPREAMAEKEMYDEYCDKFDRYEFKFDFKNASRTLFTAMNSLGSSYTDNPFATTNELPLTEHGKKEFNKIVEKLSFITDRVSRQPKEGDYLNLQDNSIFVYGGGGVL